MPKYPEKKKRTKKISKLLTSWIYILRFTTQNVFPRPIATSKPKCNLACSDILISIQLCSENKPRFALDCMDQYRLELGNLLWILIIAAYPYALQRMPALSSRGRVEDRGWQPEALGSMLASPKERVTTRARLISFLHSPVWNKVRCGCWDKRQA